MPRKEIHELVDLELNAAIAVAFFGYKPDAARGACPAYSQGIPAMWALVEKLREMGWLVNIKAMPDGAPFWLDDNYEHKLMRPYTCSLSWMRKESLEGTRFYINSHPWGFGDTPGQAVCRAALEALEDEKRFGALAAARP